MLQKLQPRSIKILLCTIGLLCITMASQAQKRNKPVVSLSDTAAPATPKTPMNRYDSAMLAHSPKKAAFRSAVLPGWGQIYNKKYWKLPIVYGALGTCAVVFTYNLKWYRRTRYAYAVLYTKDVANYGNVDPKLKVFVDNNQLETLRYYRNQYRRDIDYSALFFLLLWGLNVVDATVDAHLTSFDVSPDLSLKFSPGTTPNEVAAFTVSVKLGKKSRK